MIRQCCQCKKIELQGQWVSPRFTQLDRQDISHGYCDECFALCKKKLNEHMGHVATPWRKWAPRLF